MNIFLAAIFLVGGLIILWKSAEILVAGAVGLAEGLGVSSLVVGLTVVAMGTSAPEMAASIAAVLRGAGDVAVGDVYGSNIANLALVGGVVALIRPLRIQLRILWRELPVMLGAGLLLLPLILNRHIGRLEGIGLLVLFVVLMIFTVYSARREGKARPQILDQIADDLKQAERYAQKPMKVIILLVAGGLAGLAFGADITVRGAVVIGEKAGLSQAVIGITIVAIGTSLPELMTCLAAALRGEDDLSVGNLVGSNIFNTLLVVGVAGAVRPFALAERLVATDYWIMIGVSAGFVILGLAGRRVIGRASGVLLLGAYASYMVYLLVFTRGI